MRGNFSFQDLVGEVRFLRTNGSITLFQKETSSVFEMVNSPSGLRLKKDGKLFDVEVLFQNDQEAYVWVNGKTIILGWISSENQIGKTGEDSKREIHSVMPGRVVKVHVKPGESVELGKPLLVLEAMKMENEIKAHTDGRITEVLIQEGASVESGALLFRIEPVLEKS